MSLKIIKAGILDTIQDAGRSGFQHLGINPGGVMDLYAARLANLLVTNEKKAAVIEMHFPAPLILFEKDSIISLAGADFSPAIHGKTIPLLQPVLVKKNSTLQFQKPHKGARCYLAVYGGFELAGWLDSFSTNLKAGAGGYKGRILQKGDVIKLKKELSPAHFQPGEDFYTLPWKADEKWIDRISNSILVIPGHEWDSLTSESKKTFLEQSFTITPSSDRMGYRMSGPSLARKYDEELISSAVSFGTIQLLPYGQLIILLADHQTTGGYPRMAHIISACHAQVAQMRSGEKMKFQMTDLQTAEKLLSEQHDHLLAMENACKFKLAEFLKNYGAATGQ